MSRTFTTAANYLTAANASLFAPVAGMTVVCWALLTTSPGGSYASNLVGYTPPGYSLENYQSSYSLYCAARANQQAWSAARTHLAAIFNAASSLLYKNGASPVSGNPGVAPDGGSRLDVGNRADFASPVAGDLCEAAIWNTSLTAAEIRGLAAGVSPRVVRPMNLLAYWPIWGLSYPEPDMGKNRAHLAQVGSALAATRQMSGSPMAL